MKLKRKDRRQKDDPKTYNGDYKGKENPKQKTPNGKY